jgi:hypothetical protein
LSRSSRAQVAEQATGGSDQAIDDSDQRGVERSVDDLAEPEAASVRAAVQVAIANGSGLPARTHARAVGFRPLALSKPTDVTPIAAPSARFATKKSRILRAKTERPAKGLRST